MTTLNKSAVVAAALLNFSSWCQAAQLTKTDSVLYKLQYAIPAEWKIIRFSSDRAGKKDRMCIALKVRNAGAALRFSFDAQYKEFRYGISAPRPEASEAKENLTFWFSNNAASMTSLADHLVDVDGGEFLSATQANATPSAGDMFVDQNAVSFLYKVGTSEKTETFPLSGIKPAFAKLFDCAAGR